MISGIIDTLLNKITPRKQLQKKGMENIVLTTDFEIQALFNTIIINICSSCDILSKLT